MKKPSELNNLLVIVDMQNDFIDGVLGTPEAVKIVPFVRERIRNFRGHLFFTKDTHKDNYLETREGKKLPIPHCIRGTHGWMMHKDIGVPRGSSVAEKHSFGSFYMTKAIMEMHEEKPWDNIVLIGLCTDICVISNAMMIKSALPEVHVMVDAKCCAGTSPESHENALKAMEMCHITILR